VRTVIVDSHICLLHLWTLRQPSRFSRESAHVDYRSSLGSLITMQRYNTSSKQSLIQSRYSLSGFPRSLPIEAFGIFIDKSGLFFFMAAIFSIFPAVRNRTDTCCVRFESRYADTFRLKYRRRSLADKLVQVSIVLQQPRD